MTHVKALVAGQSSQETSEPITPAAMTLLTSDSDNYTGRLEWYFDILKNLDHFSLNKNCL